MHNHCTQDMHCNWSACSLQCIVRRSRRKIQREANESAMVWDRTGMTAANLFSTKYQSVQCIQFERTRNGSFQTQDNAYRQSKLCPSCGWLRRKNVNLVNRSFTDIKRTTQPPPRLPLPFRYPAWPLVHAIIPNKSSPGSVCADRPARSALQH